MINKRILYTIRFTNHMLCILLAVSMRNKIDTHVHAPERLFLNSLASPDTRNLYMIYLQKYLKAFGYRDLNDLADKGIRNPKQIENDILNHIIMLKEKGQLAQHLNIFNRYTLCL